VNSPRYPLPSGNTPRAKLLALATVGLLTFVGLIVAMLLRFLLGGTLGATEGDVARFDIRAPRRVEYVSDIETRRQQDLAEGAVSPIFTPLDAQVARQQVAAARSTLDQIALIRGNGASEGERISALMTLQPLALPEPIARAIVAHSDTQWGRIDAQIMTVLDNAMRAPIRPDNLDQARNSLRQQISLSLSTSDAALVELIAGTLIVPNTNYDGAGTDAARNAARSAIKPVERVFESNQIVVRSGQVLGPSDIEALDKLNLRRPSLSQLDVLSAVMLSALSVFLMALTLLRRSVTVRNVAVRNVALTAAALTLATLLARWLLPGHGLLPYLAPLAAVGIAATALSGTLSGVTAALLCSLMTGMAMDKPLEYTALFGVGGAIASLVLGRATRLSDFVRAGLFAALGQCAVVLVFNLSGTLQPEDLPQLVSYLIAAFVGGVIASGLALGALYLASLAFDITTVVQLIDLARPSHPLIQKLLLQAPGTYHHSLMVGNLAEQAAERIGADSFLVRVGAYYHDIGKLEHPHHFIENQIDGVNIHDELAPRASAALLHAHVTNGLKLARQFRLPEAIRTFIAQHHGSMRANYQYARAVKAANGVHIDDTPFRYPGPRPQSRETALLMLADASEASVRAAKCKTVDEMEAVVQRVFNDRLSDRQLDDSNLTLTDLDAIRKSFHETLRGVYHPRVEYPDAIPVAPPDAPRAETIAVNPPNA
jgi:cyclic-di-AMP phosphodiesterase PgpH